MTSLQGLAHLKDMPRFLVAEVSKMPNLIQVHQFWFSRCSFGSVLVQFWFSFGSVWFSWFSFGSVQFGFS